MSSNTSSSRADISSSINKNSSNSIESSVTRLLVSTKHLLESLTQWARREADDKYVSDAYVKLGNDFRIAIRAFSHAGVDVSDIGDVPQELREVLEAALSESPVQENLDRFLPTIRNIIVSLLQNLKHKQIKAKALAAGKDSSRRASKAPEAKVPTLNASKVKKESISSSENNQHQTSNGALAQLQRGDSLQRRASKRFSAYQYAKLANRNASGSINRIHSKENEDQHSPPHPSNSSIGHSANLDDNIFVFLRIGERTKKVKLAKPVSFAMLRLLFVETFAFSPGTSAFPYVYITDPNGSVSYELEESMLETEIKEGCILSLPVQPENSEVKNMEKKMSILEEHLNKLSTSLKQTFSSSLENIKVDFTSQISEVLKKLEVSQSPGGKEPPASFPKKSDASISDIRQLDSIKRELAVLRQIQTQQSSKVTDTTTSLFTLIKQLKDQAPDVSTASNRKYMHTCNAKLSEGSDALLTKVDDLQDIMEAMRKDIAQRGVKVTDKRLQGIRNEINEAKSSLLHMMNFIGAEKPQWKKIWESELDRVCEEQQFFNLQDDLTKDLEEDLERIEETFRLIEQCTIEQNKSNVRKAKFNPYLHLPVPGESLFDIKSGVLNEVAALQPNHEQRIMAIEKAEKIREKERNFMELSKFQEELGSFVEDGKLRKSGGIEEAERIRHQKDVENMKNSMGIV